ncbi:hypothetical protein NE237_009319 [Protea cynaroides]|uniref:WRC domain-containing protein n=1 Tax=Protea cynaroides TaxID=273540 RepID=A0A9Q0R0I8_9MAGN|nr:hypothetical protein NE237_009319 [Protea cynaroides]
MRIRKRSVPFAFSSLGPTIPPDPQLHKVLSSEEPLEPDSKAGREGVDEEQQKGAKTKSSKHQQPNGEDLSSVAVKVEERTHLDDHQPQTQTSSNPPAPLPFKLEDNRHRPILDLQLTIIKAKDGWICSDSVGKRGEEQKITKDESCCMCPNTPSHAEQSVVLGLQAEEEKTKGKRWPVLIKNSRNASSLGAEAAGGEIGASGLLSSSSNKAGRWYEGEKDFPLKKRRGSFDRKASEETMRTILKTKTNKRCIHPEDKDKAEAQGKKGLTNCGESSNNSVKKKGSRGVVMEGSRCSRVNGRGWRCCQPTLVGYSLCEHHLGKGRLRSMSTVRTPASSIIAELNKPSWSLSSSSSEEEEKPLMSTNKRKKIGMVKARSISSLLAQT